MKWVHNRIIRKRISLLFCLLIAVELWLSASYTLALPNGQGPEVFLTGDLKSKKPAEKFNCYEKIYIHATFSNLKKTDHEASVFWINPNGKQQEYSNFRFKGGNKSVVWFWLKLHPAKSKVFKTIVPSSGMEQFIGNWMVRLYLDGEIVAANRFYVVC